MSKRSLLSLFWFMALMIIVHSGSIAAPQKEERQIKSFTKVSLSISADVYLTQGNKTELILEGDAETLQHIETEVENGTLKIKYDKWRMQNTKKVVIHLSSANYEGLYVAGSGDITAQTQISGNMMNLAVSGSGSINIKSLQTDQIEAKISGSGDINLGGSKMASSMEIAISGSGDIDVSSLQIEDVSVSISGSGGARVHAVSKLKVQISGSGNVHYSGDAQIDARISGSGKVKPL